MCTRFAADLPTSRFSALTAKLVPRRINCEEKDPNSVVPSGNDAAMQPPTTGQLLRAALHYVPGVHVDPHQMPREDSFSWGDEGPDVPMAL